MEKTVAYTSQNTYQTLNVLGSKTKNVWLVFHGMGYLSRYFITYFKQLNPDENYVIAPQAPSKYYLKDEFKYVGASWLTKEQTVMETENNLAFIDAVVKSEQVPTHLNLIVFGFSQGVSIAARWVARRKISCQTLVLYAGGIPNELKPEDFGHLDWNKTSVKIIYGDTDEYLTPERRKIEHQKIKLLFPEHTEIINFVGGHEIKPELIKDIL